MTLVGKISDSSIIHKLSYLNLNSIWAVTLTQSQLVDSAVYQSVPSPNVVRLWALVLLPHRRRTWAGSPGGSKMAD